jgi:hypothetical protein
MIDKFLNSVPKKFHSSTLGFGLHQQNEDIECGNPQNPGESLGTNDKVIPGSNMADQARNIGNVFETRIDSKEIEDLWKNRRKRQE